MTRGSLFFTALVTSLLSGLLVSTPTAHAAGSPLRILLEGDSITQGFNGDFTWRYRLDKEIGRQGANIDLVGSRRSPFVRSGFKSSQYADPRFDSNHFAQVSSTFARHTAEVYDEVRGQQPDVVVVALGINDLRSGRSVSDTNYWLRRLDQRGEAGEEQHPHHRLAGARRHRPSTSPGCRSASATSGCWRPRPWPR